MNQLGAITPNIWKVYLLLEDGNVNGVGIIPPLAYFWVGDRPSFSFVLCVPGFLLDCELAWFAASLLSFWGSMAPNSLDGV